MSLVQRAARDSGPAATDNSKEFKFATLRFIPPTTYDSAKRTIEELMLQATTVLMQKAMHFEADHSWDMYSESLDAYQAAGQHLQQIAEEMEARRRLLAEDGNMSKAKLAEATAARAWTLLCNCALNLEAMDTGFLVAQWPKWHEDVELVRIAANKTFTAAQRMGQPSVSLPVSLLLKDKAEHPSPKPSSASLADPDPPASLTPPVSPVPAKVLPQVQVNIVRARGHSKTASIDKPLPPKAQRAHPSLPNYPPGVKPFPTSEGVFMKPQPSPVRMSPAIPVVNLPQTTPPVVQDKKHHNAEYDPVVVENASVGNNLEDEDPHFTEIQEDASRPYEGNLIKPDAIVEPPHEEQYEERRPQTPPASEPGSIGSPAKEERHEERRPQTPPEPEPNSIAVSAKENIPPLQQPEPVKIPVTRLAEKSLWDMTSDELAELEEHDAQPKPELQEKRFENIEPEVSEDSWIQSLAKEAPRAPPAPAPAAYKAESPPYAQVAPKAQAPAPAPVAHRAPNPSPAPLRELQNRPAKPTPAELVSAFTFSPGRPSFIPETRNSAAAMNHGQPQYRQEAPGSPEWVTGETSELPREQIFTDDSYDELAEMEEFSFSLPPRIAMPTNVNRRTGEMANARSNKPVAEARRSSPATPKAPASEAGSSSSVPSSPAELLQEQKKKWAERFQNLQSRSYGRR